MPHPPQQQPTTVVVVLGADTLFEDILARLLEREGYPTRILGASHPKDLTDELFDGVDVLLLAPGLRDDVRGAFLKAMNTTPRNAAIPVLSLSSALKRALLDELSASLSWCNLFEELTQQIRATLEAASAKALGVDSPETA